MAGNDRADHDAGRLPVLRHKALVINSVDAQRAFLHDPAVFVEFARTVWTSPGAQLATDADRLVDQYDAVFGALIGGAGWADRDASRLLAMQTRFGEMDRARTRALALLKGVDAVEPYAPRAVAIGAEIRQRPHMTACGPFLAGRRARVTTDADVEVDDKPELFAVRTGFWQRGHGDPRSPCLPAKYRRTPARRPSEAGCSRGRNAGADVPASLGAARSILT